MYKMNVINSRKPDSELSNSMMKYKRNPESYEKMKKKVAKYNATHKEERHAYYLKWYAKNGAEINAKKRAKRAEARAQRKAEKEALKALK